MTFFLIWEFCRVFAWVFKSILQAQETNFVNIQVNKKLKIKNIQNKVEILEKILV